MITTKVHYIIQVRQFSGIWAQSTALAEEFDTENEAYRAIFIRGTFMPESYRVVRVTTKIRVTKTLKIIRRP
jgi:hypothetical protein